jgi:hypothetical protein
MDIKTIAALLSSLAGAPLLVGCTKPPAAEPPELPASEDPQDPEDPALGEHACGNHAEGACGSAAADEAPPTSRSLSIAPGEFAEVNLEMVAGSTVVLVFSGGSPDIDWDIHSHGPAGETTIHHSGRGGRGTIEFEPDFAGGFSMLWKNNGSTATPLDVQVGLHEGVSIHSWIPAP